MKKLMRFCPIIITIILFLINSDCKKVDVLPQNDGVPSITDIVFADKYMGVWSFKYTTSYYDKEHRVTTVSSVLYTGVINYDPKNDKFIIQYTEGSSLGIRIETDGSIKNTCFCQSCDCSGHFEGDSLLYYSTWSITLTSSFQTSLVGKKISKINYLASEPTAVTSSGTGSMTSATLTGTVNPNFLLTTVSFEFGETSEYGETIAASTELLSGSTNINVDAVPVGLTPGKEYHFRVKAVNSLGITYGNDMIFKTLNSYGELYGEVIDIDLNRSQTVAIGDQIWMTENLKVTKYNDGIPIPLVTEKSLWETLSTPAYCWYKNDTANKSQYGALYNWHAVNTNKLCPIGWHVASLGEWTTLTLYAGGKEVAGNRLKEAGTVHWNVASPDVRNETRFTALPGGLRTNSSSFISLKSLGAWWSTTENNSIELDNSSPTVINRSHTGSGHGLSVRCIKD
jgi:uncharacterized protein (TIGR02145 family)